MAVLNPIKVTITNYTGEEEVEAVINPVKENSPARKVKFSKTVYIDGADFALVPPPRYNRLKEGGMVRLKNAYIIKCDKVIKDEDDNVKELECSYIPESRSNNDTSGIKVKGTIQWVNAETA